MRDNFTWTKKIVLMTSSYPFYSRTGNTGWGTIHAHSHLFVCFGNRSRNFRTKIQNWTQEPGALRCFALYHQNQAILLTSQGAGDTHGIRVFEVKLYKRLCYKFEPHVVVCCPKGSGFWQQDPVHFSVPMTFKNDVFFLKIRCVFWPDFKRTCLPAGKTGKSR